MSEAFIAEMVPKLERLATEAGLKAIAHYLRMAMMTQREPDMNDDYTTGHGASHRDEAASAATRMIERKMAEAVGVEHKDVPDPSLAAMIEDIRVQLKTLNDKMEAGFKIAGQSITAIEGRLGKIEKFLHVPPDLVEALKNGHKP